MVAAPQPATRRASGVRRTRTRTAWLSRHLLLVVASLVAASAAIRFAASTHFAAPWIAPDEMIYGLSGSSFWATGKSTLLGAEAPFYGLYPLLVGLPLHLLGPAAGVTAAQLVQAILMSLTIVVVWAWARPLAGDVWALTAAALVGCLPALAYSGLLMSESAFLPAGTLALWLTARAIEQPSRGRQAVLIAALALATGARLQGLILFPILVTALLLAAWFARDASIFRRFAPTWIVLGGAVVLWAGAELAVNRSLAPGLGAYDAILSGGYDAGEVARWVARHAGDLFLLVLGVPLLATALLTFDGLRGRERDGGVRALVAVALSASLWLTVQVGAFASRYVGQLAERDLIVAVPPLLVCLAVWLSRGLPRPQPATTVIAVVVALPAALLPVGKLVTPAATPDAFMTVPLLRLLGATSVSFVEAAWLAGVVLVVVAAVLLPARAAAAIPVVIGITLAGSSFLASSEISRLTAASDAQFFGAASRSWVDDAATGPVTYVDTGSAYWNGIWKTAFWNERIQQVTHLAETPPGGLVAEEVTPRGDGTLVDSLNRPLANRELVASSWLSFVGEPVAEIAQTGSDLAGLRLWRTPGAPRVSTLTVGLKPNGDIVQPVSVYVFACSGGRLELTLLGKDGTPVEIRRDRRVVARFTPPAGGVWSGSVAAPTHPTADRVCVFHLESAGLVGSTRLEFVRG